MAIQRCDVKTKGMSDFPSAGMKAITKMCFESRFMLWRIRRSAIEHGETILFHFWSCKSAMPTQRD
jgi:hypothetical protein